MTEKKKEICSHYGTCHQVVNRGVCIADAAEIECGYDSRKQISPLEILENYIKNKNDGLPHMIPDFDIDRGDVLDLIKAIRINPQSVIERGKTEGWLK